MPCSDGLDEYYQQKALEKAFSAGASSVGSNDKSVTILLCSACRSLERLDYDFDENPMLSVWWDKHKKLDKDKHHD